MSRLRKPTEKWIRAFVAGSCLADSRSAIMVGDAYRPVTYFFPVNDLVQEAVGAWNDAEIPILGRGETAPLKDRDQEGRTGALFLRLDDVPDHIGLAWDAVDSWLEEDEEAIVHPRDPDKRIDALRSSRDLRVEIDGTLLAETDRPVLLFENPGLLPVRYYIPPADVKLERLRPSETTTACPYKGYADYHHVDADSGTHTDLVWRYRAPFAEVMNIRGMFCFFNERVDITLDGEPIPRPKTPWS